jgi:hypothetical protein
VQTAPCCTCTQRKLTSGFCQCCVYTALHTQQGNDLSATKDSSSGDGGIRLGRLKKSGLGSKTGAKGTIAGSTGIRVFIVKVTLVCECGRTHRCIMVVNCQVLAACCPCGNVGTAVLCSTCATCKHATTAMKRSAVALQRCCAQMWIVVTHIGRMLFVCSHTYIHTLHA